MDALGHIHPLLSIARELIARGHHVTFLTVRKLNNCEKFANTGIKFQHCFDSDTDNHDTDGVKCRETSDKMNYSVMNPLIRRFRSGIKESFEATYALDGACGKHVIDIIGKHDYIQSKLQSLEPDLIVVDYIVGIPSATTVAPKWVRFYSGYPSVLYSAYNENFVAGRGLKLEQMTAEEKQFERKTKSLIIGMLQNFFKEKGLDTWHNDIELAPTSPYLNFCMGPDELSLENIPSLNPIPKTWVRLEHTIDEPEPSYRFKIPDTLTKQPGKLIYFSLGTLVTSDVELINRLLEILSKSPNKFIVSKGQMHEQIKMYPNMWGDKFLDQKAILPQVDLFITHGGHNSIIEAFYYGVPGLLVLPVFADQFDSAQRVEDCGYGIRLNPYECSEQQLLNSIDLLTSNNGLRAKMHAIGSRMRSIEYHKISVDHLERLLTD